MRSWNSDSGSKNSFSWNAGNGQPKNVVSSAGNRSWQSPARNSATSSKGSGNMGEVKRQPGQCFKCGDRYFSGHVCKKQLMNMEVEEDIEEAEQDEQDQESGEEEPEMEQDNAELSIHAMNGQFSHSTMKFKGSVGNRPLLILIDSGSTHSFLDEEVSKELKCKVRKAAPLAVTIANGQKMLSAAKTEGFYWKLQGHKFVAKLRLLKLGGCDMVLGTDWIKEYSPMIFDLKKMEVSFDKEGRKKSAVKGKCRGSCTKNDIRKKAAIPDQRRNAQHDSPTVFNNSHGGRKDSHKDTGGESP